MSGPAGTVVIINGSGFDPSNSNNIVYFGACRAAVQSSSANSLTVQCPPGATYESISVTTGGKTGYSSKPFLVTFPAGNAITPANLGVPVSFVTDAYPRNAMIADLDDNGKSEILVVHSNAATLSVYRNISTPENINFASRLDFPLPAINTQYIAKGDLDGDGKPDLIIANYGVNSLSVFRNTSVPGTISFSDGGVYSTNMNPIGIAVADYDLDGKPDLAVANNNSHNVSVFRNLSTAGIISFAPQLSFPVGNWPFNIFSSDVDGDGKSDIAVPNYNEGTVSVLKNSSTSGNIFFNAKVDFTTGTNPAFLVMGDLDDDNKPDLAVTNGGSQSISVFKNTSAPGTISFSARTDITTGNIPHGISMGDIDGDTKTDLVVANFGSSTLSIIKNTSTGGVISFAPKVDFATGNTTRSVPVADLDGDSKPDIACIRSIDNIVTAFRNQAGEYTVYPACVNSNITFTSEITGSSYRWEERTGNFWNTVSNGGNYSGATTANLVISSVPASHNNYQYRCLVDVVNKTQIKLLTTHTSVTPVVSIQTPVTNICSGNSVTITSTAEFGGSSPVYQWQVNGINTGSNSPSLTTSILSNGDQVKLILTSDLPCASPASVSSNTVSFTIALATPSITANNNVLMVSNPDPGAVYTWEKQDAVGNWAPVSPPATGTSYTAATSGNYRTKGTKGNCTEYSNSVNLIITAVSNSNFENTDLRIFPNPASDELRIDSLKPSYKWETLDITNSHGKPVLSNQNIKGLSVVKLNIQHLPRGFYMIILRRSNGRFTSLKFIKL